MGEACFQFLAFGDEEAGRVGGVPLLDPVRGELLPSPGLRALASSGELAGGS